MALKSNSSKVKFIGRVCPVRMWTPVGLVALKALLRAAPVKILVPLAQRSEACGATL
jgi:hypothetical protein